MKTDMLRGVSITSATVAKKRARVDEDAGGVGGSSLAQLESVLQQLSKHEHRTHIESVERTSAHTQQQLLKDRLLQVQEELEKAQGDKAMLCEKLGALQQAKDGQQSEIDHLLMELRSSRESQFVMGKKVAQLENETLDMKRHYVRSVTFRTKTASELLARLNINGVLQGGADVSTTVAAACDSWNGVNHKRKRVEETVEHATVVVDEVDADEIMDEERSVPPDQVTVANNAQTQVPQERMLATDSTSEMSEECPRECQSCIGLVNENEKLKQEAEQRLEEANRSLAALKGQIDALTHSQGQAEGTISTMSCALCEKEGAIEQLRAELETERQQAEELRLESISKSDEEMKEKDAGDEANDRAKVLEDNLAQLNTYADHLEMIISQCASCAVKLQSEATQDLSAK